MKKILSFISIFLILFVLCSCTKYEDLVPNSDDYASWDGLYIYKGNYRSKTTGEDEERLIKNINYFTEDVFTGTEEMSGDDFQIEFHWIPLVQLSNIKIYPEKATELMMRLDGGVKHFIDKEI